ncbi:hypothetical protein HYQ46_000511 [Verticillium longisporum]|nr:hypothetical protein HYQ46_000511 [Verticillium longisporum]
MSEVSSRLEVDMFRLRKLLKLDEDLNFELLQVLTRKSTASHSLARYWRWEGGGSVGGLPGASVLLRVNPNAAVKAVAALKSRLRVFERGRGYRTWRRMTATDIDPHPSVKGRKLDLC